MGAPGMKFILIGLVIVVLGYFFRESIDGFASGLFMITEIIGAAIILYGAFQFFYNKGKTAAGGEDDHIRLRNDVLLKTLSRLTYADSNTKAVEVEMVQKIYQRETGHSVSKAEIRVAARGDLHETQAFDRYLTKAGTKLQPEDKSFIVRAMAEVVKSDGNISPGEVEFFDEVGRCFKMNPSELSELQK